MQMAQLKSEIESGPLAALCAPYWLDVFDDAEPLRTKLVGRQGLLKPDAAYEIWRILSDDTRRTKLVTVVSRGVFIGAISPHLSPIASGAMADASRGYWQLIMALLPGADEEVDLSMPSIQSLLLAAQNDGIVTEQQRQTILACGGTTTQSRLAELGWRATVDDVQRCKKEG